MTISIRDYHDSDEQEWMRVHALIMTISHAWNYCIQERPVYEKCDSTCLVALEDRDIVGLTDVKYDSEADSICFLKDSPGGYVLEFGRLPEHKGKQIGKMLIDATIEDARAKGYSRLEYWSQDRKAQRYYARLGMTEIGRHYRFRARPPKEVEEIMGKTTIGIEYLYCACLPEEWPRIRDQHEILDKHPLEPHLCIGYEIRF